MRIQKQSRTLTGRYRDFTVGRIFGQLRFDVGVKEWSDAESGKGEKTS